MLLNRHPFGAGLSIEKHTLDNGLHVILLRDPSAPVISYHTWYRVGSRHEEEGKTGIAHLFEHLMFNQTEHLAAGEFDRLMESAGGDTNAATWVDWTYYRDNLPASKLDLAVKLEADRMQHLTLTDAQVDSEREVVANERRFSVEDTVDGFLSEELFKLAFDKHPYHHPTIGWMRDIHAITTDDARQFYRTFYAPNNAVIVLAGDFDIDKALVAIEARYGEIPASKIPELAAPAEPAQGGERRARFAKPVAADRAIFAYKAPAQGDPDWLPLLFAQELLLGGPSSRLYRKLVIVDEAAAGAQGMVAPFRDPGLYEIVVSMKRGHAAAEAEAALDAEVARLIEQPIPEAEMTKVRNRMETDFWDDLETVDGKASQLGHYETTLGDYRRLFEVAERVHTVTTEDVRRAAETWLRRDGRTVVVAEPSGEPPGEGEEEAEADGGEDVGGAVS
jgi:zinc protease